MPNERDLEKREERKRRQKKRWREGGERCKGQNRGRQEEKSKR